jgi:hypothetical protein
LTATHPIKPTSTRCPSAWQPNPRQRLHLAMRKICSENRDHYRVKTRAPARRENAFFRHPLDGRTPARPSCRSRAAKAEGRSRPPSRSRARCAAHCAPRHPGKLPRSPSKSNDYQLIVADRNSGTIEADVLYFEAPFGKVRFIPKHFIRGNVFYYIVSQRTKPAD